MWRLPRFLSQSLMDSWWIVIFPITGLCWCSAVNVMVQDDLFSWITIKSTRSWFVLWKFVPLAISLAPHQNCCLSLLKMFRSFHAFPPDISPCINPLFSYALKLLEWITMCSLCSNVNSNSDEGPKYRVSIQSSSLFNKIGVKVLKYENHFMKLFHSKIWKVFMSNL